MSHPLSAIQLYTRTTLFGVVIFFVTYLYIFWQGIPSPLNKAVADTATLLIGLSMLLSGLCYFWNSLDTKIVYRKYLGLVGFAFALVHFGLSFSAFQRLLQPETWERNAIWAPLTGLIAIGIFTIMALISNVFSARLLGGKLWRQILRTGYIAMLFVLAHVVSLKASRWVPWFTDGMTTFPSASLLISAFIVLVVIMRLLLTFSLKKNSAKHK